jgi:hippurate hydrolase
MDLIGARLPQIAASVAQAFGAEATTQVRLIFAPVVNNADEAQFAARICSEVAGADNVERNPPLIMASEDFSFMLERVPGCYLNVGAGLGAGWGVLARLRLAIRRCRSARATRG